LSRYYLVDALSLLVADVGFTRLSKTNKQTTIQKKKHQNESQRLSTPKRFSTQQLITPQSF